MSSFLRTRVIIPAFSEIVNPVSLNRAFAGMTNWEFRVASRGASRGALCRAGPQALGTGITICMTKYAQTKVRTIT